MCEQSADYDTSVTTELTREGIAEVLRGRILRGLHSRSLASGDRLPSARELGAEFDIDHRVVLAAYRELASEGLIELRQRGGIYVARRDDTLVRIACQELEAWYFGAPDALASAFDRPDLRRLGDRARFRDPDAIEQPSRALTALVAEFQKVSGARRMAQVLTPENRSRSFQVLIAGIERLLGDN